mmetsp:Transcript_16767/g.29526  ORF Transcript_16767/g.29526 Transcript_16767/m.29526 type:complete len:206 (-) Transcript_16767:1562-2179(-)
MTQQPPFASACLSVPALDAAAAELVVLPSFTYFVSITGSSEAGLPFVSITGGSEGRLAIRFFWLLIVNFRSWFRNWLFILRNWLSILLICLPCSLLSCGLFQLGLFCCLFLFCCCQSLLFLSFGIGLKLFLGCIILDVRGPIRVVHPLLSSSHLLLLFILGCIIFIRIVHPLLFSSHLLFFRFFFVGNIIFHAQGIHLAHVIRVI